MIPRLRLMFLTAFMVPVTIAAMPFQYLMLYVSPPVSRRIPLWWHRMLIKMVGVRVIVRGEIPKDRPMMIVSNHVSWFDIPVLGSVMELCFIAKREVASIPFANLLARLQRTVFVHREHRQGSVRQALEITERINSGDVMVLFAEGTTGDGHKVRQFKSSLFGAAQYAVKEGDVHQVLIQPVSIAYTHLFGMPLGRFHRSQAAWPGNLSLGPHAKNFFGKGAFDVVVSFGEPIKFDEESNRREVANLTQSMVRDLYTESLRQTS